MNASGPDERVVATFQGQSVRRGCFVLHQVLILYYSTSELESQIQFRETLPANYLTIRWRDSFAQPTCRVCAKKLVGILRLLYGGQETNIFATLLMFSTHQEILKFSHDEARICQYFRL